MNKRPSRHVIPAGCKVLLLSFCLHVTAVYTQNINLQQEIDDAVAILQQLDTLASACLAELDENAGAKTDNRCVEFLAGIDGELLGRYLTHCQILQDWREQFVSRQFAAETEPDNQDNALRLLVGVNYACAEGALQLRTEFVTTAFNLLHEGAAGTNQQSGILSRDLRELQFDNTLNAERRLMQDALQQQQLQRQLESDRRRQQIENELIRQQRSLPVQ